MKYLLKNGTVVTGEKSEQLDILVEGEKIAQVGKNLPSEEAQEIDVSGKILFPGFIDGHTHFDLEVAGTVTADDFETGTKAAILGGTTFVIDYASQDKGGHTLKEGLDKWHKKADDKCSCDYSFHMSIVEWNENTEQEIQDMIDHGITSFKLYMTYPAMIVNDCDMYKILKKLGKCGCFAGVHCENAGVIDALIAEAKKEGRLGPENHPLVRPDTMEAEAVHRLLVIASEDIGLAYPMAAVIVKACVDSALQLGLPEARIPLAQAAVLLATAPKSNSAYSGIDAALADVRAGLAGPIPRCLQNKHYDGADVTRPGQFYKYPHDFPGHFVRQQYLPDTLLGRTYYTFGDNRTEQAARAYREKLERETDA